jgi:hypothetical protein
MHSDRRCILIVAGQISDRRGVVTFAGIEGGVNFGSGKDSGAKLERKVASVGGQGEVLRERNLEWVVELVVDGDFALADVLGDSLILLVVSSESLVAGGLVELEMRGFVEGRIRLGITESTESNFVVNMKIFCDVP